MNDPNPVHIVYVRKEPEEGKSVVGGPCLILLVKGYAYCRLLGADGTLYFNDDGKTPALFLGAPGMVIHFKTTKDRENGYIEFNADIVRKGRPGFVELKEGDYWIEVPCALTLSASETSFLQDEFEMLQKAWAVPIPLNLFKIKAGIIGLLRLFIERSEPTWTEGLSPAQKLRRLIDEDTQFTCSLAVLSRQCGFSSDHMRKLFRERYHISPQAYRHRQRMGRAMDLMVSSESSLPQIATKTGFHHVTHFCTSFKKAFHMTPSQGLKRFRRQSQSTQGSRK
jgi:AraC-like DNA-binding protein